MPSIMIFNASHPWLGLGKKDPVLLKRMPLKLLPMHWMMTG